VLSSVLDKVRLRFVPSALELSLLLGSDESSDDGVEDEVLPHFKRVLDVVFSDGESEDASVEVLEYPSEDPGAARIASMAGRQRGQW
jgi:hypothetical protein